MLVRRLGEADKRVGPSLLRVKKRVRVHPPTDPVSVLLLNHGAELKQRRRGPVFALRNKLMAI